jgi:nitroreductase
MKILDVIKCRQSIRKYIDKPIEDQYITDLTKFIESIQFFNPNIQLKPLFLTKNDVSSRVSAPYFIALYSENKSGYETNAGFYLAQIELFLQCLGLGCCYIGMGKPKTSVIPPEGMEFVILLGYGYPAFKLYRDEKEFKRKEIDKISNVDNELVRLASLAPSGMNLQPWYIFIEDKSIDIFRKSPVLAPNMIKKMNLFDVGIVILYVYLILQDEGKTVNFIQKDLSNSKNGEYITTLSF